MSAPAFRLLTGIDAGRQVSFVGRSASLLNLPDHGDLGFSVHRCRDHRTRSDERAPSHQLVDAIRSQNALLVVGTGVTLLTTEQAPTASWRGLMEHGKERVADLRQDLAADWVGVVSRDIASDKVRDMLVGAQRITDELQGLPGNQYDKWLSDAVGGLKATSPGILGALVELASLSRPRTTTP